MFLKHHPLNMYLSGVFLEQFYSDLSRQMKRLFSIELTSFSQFLKFDFSVVDESWNTFRLFTGRTLNSWLDWLLTRWQESLSKILRLDKLVIELSQYMFNHSNLSRTCVIVAKQRVYVGTNKSFNWIAS